MIWKCEKVENEENLGIYYRGKSKFRAFTTRAKNDFKIFTNLREESKYLPIKRSTIVHFEDNTKFVRINKVNNANTDAKHQTQASSSQYQPKTPAQLKF